MKRTFGKIIILKALLWCVFCLGFPLFGIWLGGGDFKPLLGFPPVEREIGEVRFSWPVGGVYWLAQGSLFQWLLWPRGRIGVPDGGTGVFAGQFPLWGWVALAWLGGAWVLAWNRFEWFGWGQDYTFAPLWFGYIFVVNALVYRRKGTCPMLERPVLFGLLFPVSAVFWWVFEYYNRFVMNWVYHQSDVGAVEYFVHASICFSTVLPAVYSTAEWLKGFPSLQGRMTGPCVRIRPANAWACLVMGVSLFAFLKIGVWSLELYPLLWTGPVLVWICLSQLTGEPEDLGDLGKGDWRVVWNWALAALICGFFWEMWNYWSLVKWEYQVPYLHGALVFEMPLAGFMGYLPFGLECYLVTQLVGRCCKA